MAVSDFKDAFMTMPIIYDKTIIENSWLPRH